MALTTSKNILITGAAGFIGFHTALSLAQRGDRVVGYDNFNDYYSPQLKYDRCQLLKKAGIEVIEGDICDTSKLKHYVKANKITHLVNLAAQAGVRYSLIHPQSYVKANLEGFVSVLETCKEQPGISLVYASSSSVYGLNRKIPFSIEDRTDQQASLYGATKKANELFAQTYHHLYGIPVTGLRFFTVYGPWGRPDMAYSLFTKAILSDEPIEIYNYGKMLRDFTYVDDIIQGILAAIDREAGCDLFNLGHHEPVELLEFIQTLEEYLGKTAIKVFKELQLGDVPETFADIRESTRSLNFIPKVGMREGLAKFLDWYREYYQV
ncbi:NAD-dependent epimerase/dehydratase family protein [Parachlamydia sp. AcF125]|uniref:NAD-dependent epimerase/dehydratase family protein n=1 Tax=Parachlamydia sp. AcF125 TaxID=2795736 RepID=UPI001BC97B65|nr:NAD-dependent epimerase/dehydratase family protein [Parachlamydia sp. AcF125]MBS4167872.1 UDP-N-acetylglucosamine 4-epimerase [Parachlamydia sp. AcF125]